MGVVAVVAVGVQNLVFLGVWVWVSGWGMSCFRKLGILEERGGADRGAASQVHMQQQRQKSKPLFGKARCGSGRKKRCGSVWKEPYFILFFFCFLGLSTAILGQPFLFSFFFFLFSFSFLFSYYYYYCTYFLLISLTNIINLSNHLTHNTVLISSSLPFSLNRAAATTLLPVIYGHPPQSTHP